MHTQVPIFFVMALAGLVSNIVQPESLVLSLGGITIGLIAGVWWGVLKHRKETREKLWR